MNAGIDYGRGQTNIDNETGIRFGLLSANNEKLSEWFWEDVEPHYSAHCPKCGSNAVSIDELADELETDTWEESQFDCVEFGCENCQLLYGESAFGDEPDCNRLVAEGYEGFVSEQNEIWVLKSPYFTRCRFCSPCAPGAGDLDSPDCDGVKTYCLGPEWFQDEEPPYEIEKA